MIINTNWYVVAGPPCAGKTTLLSSLAALGYVVTPEFPRLLIDSETRKGRTTQEIRADEGEFQKRVFEMKVAIENKISPEQITFLDDGGIPASIAYYQIAGLDPAPAIEESKKRRYQGIFFLEQLPYQKDYARVEDEKTAHRLNQLLEQAYSGLGYNVMHVPARPVEERVKFILTKINKV